MWFVMGFVSVFIAAWIIAIIKGFGPWYTTIPALTVGWFSIRYTYRLLDSYL